MPLFLPHLPNKLEYQKKKESFASTWPEGQNEGTEEHHSCKQGTPFSAQVQFNSL